ncbi:hypothetical protein JXB31_02330 [Candidatus Woesearchaeota archaeon]|nr:hypothetical protein [Candidatus Woesearchaeota archaeon]
MSKRGQITLFIVLGIALIAAVAFGYYLFTSTQDTDIPSDVEGADTITDFVQTCITQVAEPLIFEIAEKGGSLKPDSNVSYDNTRLNILAYYESGFGYRNNMLSRDEIEAELEEEFEERIKLCTNLDPYQEQGFKVTKGEPEADFTVGNNSVFIRLSYPIGLERGESVKNVKDFSASIAIPLGRLYAASIDIVNAEASDGYFNKEDFMLEQGGCIMVEKHKPYPDTIYELKHYLPDFRRMLVFNFAIKGVDTVGKEVIRYKQGGCCIREDGLCFKNVEKSLCKSPNRYVDSAACTCEKYIEPTVEGCCENNYNCQLTTENDCLAMGGVFHKDDLRCLNAHCINLDCSNVYDYVDNNYTGGSRKHGDSWCSYESMVGNGKDYVGSRHYLHSCINGVEYVEECRDYREELCAEDSAEEFGKYYRVSGCRLNRWYDCNEQTTQSDCEDTLVRDCSWADYIWTEMKCHPTVSPGFKFWEDDAKDICNVASMTKDFYGNNFPVSWGHSALLYCQRSGDCGNYRNIADELTTLGYYNQDITPEFWAYWDDGYVKRGDEFVLHADITNTNIESSANIPHGAGSGDAICDQWLAPTVNMCSLCSASLVHPCTEYKCRSLGRNCVYSDGECTLDSISAFDLPEVYLKEIQSGYDYIEGYNDYYGGTEYNITPRLHPYQPISFVIETSKPTRCKLSMYPPGYGTGGTSLPISLPEIMLNDYSYKTEYDVTMRLPSVNFTAMDYLLVFVKCYDSSGFSNDEESILIFNMDAPASDNIPPEILDIIKPPMILRDNLNTFGILVNEPFSSCRYAFSNVVYDDMLEINCSAAESDVIYNVGYPLGSYPCSAEVNVSSGPSELYFACKDKSNNTNTNFVLTI